VTAQGPGTSRPAARRPRPAVCGAKRLPVPDRRAKSEALCLRTQPEPSLNISHSNPAQTRTGYREARTLTPAYVCACVRLCTCTCLRLRVWVRMHACIHVHVRVHMCPRVHGRRLMLILAGTARGPGLRGHGGRNGGWGLAEQLRRTPTPSSRSRRIARCRKVLGCLTRSHRGVCWRCVPCCARLSYGGSHTLSCTIV